MYIHVKVTAGAKKESFKKFKEDHFIATVKEPAQRNMANKKVLELVAAYFAVLPGKVRITSGHRSPSKIFRVDGA